MTLVAWAPQGSDPRICAVLALPGPLSKLGWVELMHDRLFDMMKAVGEQGSRELFEQYIAPHHLTFGLNFPWSQWPAYLLHDDPLYDRLSMAVPGTWPADVPANPDPEAARALRNTGLEAWLRLLFPSEPDWR